MKWYERVAEAGNKFLKGVVEVTHLALDVAGFIPGVGAVPDLVNAGIYALEGDWGNAAFSAAAAVPFIGDAAAVGKVVKRVDGVVDAVKGLKNLAILDKVKPLINVLKGKLDELFDLLDFTDELRKLMNKMLNKISGLMKEGGKLLSKIGKKMKQELIKLKNKVKNLFKKIFKGASKFDDTFKQLKTKIDDVELPEGTWSKGPTERGKIIDELMGNNVGDNFPVIDKFDEATGTVTSVKSRDLNTKTYQNGQKLENTIKKDIDKVSSFEGASWGGTVVKQSEINAKQLQIVVPDATLSQKQIEAINNAVQYGKDKGVTVIITVGR